MPRLTKNEDVCIHCHRCESICTWAHEVVFNPKRGRIIVDLEEPDTHHIRLCIQCGRCADACPVDAIYQDFTILTTSEQGIYRLDPDKCIGCGDCLDVCPTQRAAVLPGPADAPEMRLLPGPAQCVRYCPTNALSWVLG